MNAIINFINRCHIAIALIFVFAGALPVAAGQNSISVAPAADLGGRVMRGSGQPASGISLSATDSRTGRQYSATTNADGIYRFERLETGTSYFITAAHRNVSLAPSNQTIEHAAERLDINFVAERAVERAARNDFDGDGKTDIAVFRPSEGAWYILQSATGTFRAEHWGLASDQLIPADYDGDGKTDLAVFRAGNWYIKNSATDSMTALQFGFSSDKPVAADYDGDNRDDIAVYRPANGTWYLIYSSNNRLRAVKWGIDGDKTLPADYDGDGKADFAVFRPSARSWYINRSADNSLFTVQFGISNDIPLTGDFDGDAKADIVINRPFDNSWYFILSSGGLRDITFDRQRGAPAPGDYDGDGKEDVAGFNQFGNWSVLQSANDEIRTQDWGQGGDKTLVTLQQ